MKKKSKAVIWIEKHYTWFFFTGIGFVFAGVALVLYGASLKMETYSIAGAILPTNFVQIMGFVVALLPVAIWGYAQWKK